VLLTPLVPRFLESFPDVPLEVAMMRRTVRRLGCCDSNRSSAEGGALSAAWCSAGVAVCHTGVPAAAWCPSRPEDLRAHDRLHLKRPMCRSSACASSAGSQRAEVLGVTKLAVNDPAASSATAAGLGIGLLPQFSCGAWDWPPPPEAGVAGVDRAPAAALYAIYPAALEQTCECNASSIFSLRT